jgi:hypothetical protein
VREGRGERGEGREERGEKRGERREERGEREAGQDGDRADDGALVCCRRSS